MKLRNYEIDAIIKQLNGEDSIMYTDKIKIGWDIIWEIDKNYNLLSPIASKYNEMRGKIEKNYYDENKVITEENGMMRVADEYLSEFQAEMEELASIENDIDISMIEISKVSSYVNEPKYFRQIRFMLCDPETE